MKPGEQEPARGVAPRRQLRRLEGVEKSCTDIIVITLPFQR